MTETSFTLTADFDRPLFWDQGQSVRYLVARLRADRDDRTQETRNPLNIALAIDASGSMSGGKLESAKAAALGLVEQLTDGDRLTVVSFASDIEVHLDAVLVHPDTKDQIRTEISRLTTRGMTHLSGGWFAAVDCAARIAEEAPEMTPRVIILSDGHANEGICDAGELWEHAGELRTRGVLTSAMGIGDGYDETLLRGIAENGGGRLHDAELDDEISSVLLGELSDIFGTVIEDAELRITSPANAVIELVGPRTMVFEGDEGRVNLGAVQNMVERVVVFKVTCPRSERDAVLTFDLSASGVLSGVSERVSAQAPAATLVATNAESNNAQIRDADLAEMVLRNWNAQILATVARMNRQGALQETQHYLKRELRHFERYARGTQSGRKLVKDLKLLLSRSNSHMSPRMHKEMAMASVALSEDRMDWRGPEKRSWSERLASGD